MRVDVRVPKHISSAPRRVESSIRCRKRGRSQIAISFETVCKRCCTPRRLCRQPDMAPPLAQEFRRKSEPAETIVGRSWGALRSFTLRMDEKDGSFVSPRTRNGNTGKLPSSLGVDNGRIRRRVMQFASWKSSNIKLNMAWAPLVDKFDGRAESRKMGRQGSSKIQRAGFCVVAHSRGWLQRRSNASLELINCTNLCIG